MDASMSPTYPEELLLKAKSIQLAIFDVDGVLSDGRLYFDAQGVESKSFHVRDGFGLKRLLANGIELAIITGRQSKIVSDRMSSLGIQHVFQGVEDKLSCFRHLLSTLNLKQNQACYTGDDLFDLPILSRVGLSCTVADGHPEVKKYTDFTTPHAGGRGAARDLCDLILFAKGMMNTEISRYLEQ